MNGMRLYIDQMLRLDFALMLKEHGHDVLRTEDTGQARSDDADVLKEACRQGRTLITLDAHFGDWVVLPLSQHSGVIRLKVHPPVTAALQRVIIPFLTKHRQEQFQNNLIILSANRERWISTDS